MIGKDHEEFIQKAKEDYYKIGSITCPAFANEKVQFNKYGWNHIVRKGRKFRDLKEQGIRMRLICEAVRLLMITISVQRYRKTQQGSSIGHFWEIVGANTNKNIKQNRIHVIIRKMNDGRLHFFSVF